MDGRGKSVVVDEVVAEMADCDAQRMDGTGKLKQDIPPSTRRLVLRRHHGACAVPGCLHARFLHVHHLTPKADGGGHDAENLVPACFAHHGAVHKGKLVIEGSWSTGLTFRHADGSLYGAIANPQIAATLADVHSGLVNLGFKIKEARRIVDAIRPRVGAATPLKAALRMALRYAHLGTAAEAQPSG